MRGSEGDADGREAIGYRDFWNAAAGRWRDFDRVRVLPDAWMDQVRGSHVPPHLVGASFRSADLSGVSLAGWSLPGADFSDALLLEADCSEAQMTGADFRRARLAGARFVNAELPFAEYAFADAEGASFQGAAAPFARWPEASPPPEGEGRRSLAHARKGFPPAAGEPFWGSDPHARQVALADWEARSLGLPPPTAEVMARALFALRRLARAAGAAPVTFALSDCGGVGIAVASPRDPRRRRDGLVLRVSNVQDHLTVHMLSGGVLRQFLIGSQERDMAEGVPNACAALAAHASAKSPRPAGLAP